MNFNFSRKIISPILTGIISTLFMAGLITPAFAETKSVANEGKIKLAEVKATEAKPADAMTKAPVDADFKRLDGNGDGKLSLKEAVKDRALAMQFDATDVNHDGMIAADEYAAYKATLVSKTTTEPSAVTPVTN
ncbi:MAG: EF-hand domain-containing protein [Methylophilaceae bacterium]